jgi:Protein of unknown function (DUF3810)
MKAGSVRRRIFHSLIIVLVTRVFQALMVLSACVAAVMPIDSTAIERGYSTSIYPRIQAILTPVSNLVPFALFDVLTVAAVVILILAVAFAVVRARAERRLRPLAGLLASIATTAAVVYLVFLAVWGLNYRRMPMEERLALDRAAPSTEQVVTLGLEAIRRMNGLYQEAHRTGWEPDPRYDRALLDAYAFVQQKLGAARSAVPGRLKSSIYGAYFRWTTVDGMVDPFALEVLTNPDLLPFERTFIAAHEWAHLAGFADESEANFVAWLTCIRAGAAAQYSGWLSLYWQIGSEVGPDERRRLWDAVADGPRRDVQAINDRLQRGQLPFLRKMSWRVYDGYLRANRVEEGIRSYGKVITLILRARFEDGWVPVRRPLDSAPGKPAEASGAGR